MKTKSNRKNNDGAIIIRLSDKDATMATREVTLNLMKNKDGDYKIVANDNLKAVLFTKVESLKEMFGWE
ncbi:Uncharacterised protein [Streptococcus pneumoniae]|nr:hypothetical protein BVH75_04145 [Bacillus thuringiensis]PGW73618.1 hypothetical protein COE11_21380 [Bacillus cereus]CKG85794.1 Uncharacterised protein [Streptococcus pneumoniae]HEB4951117.1 hypothetical protein [Bacillus cereus]HEF5709705.1 hypothetical protein [Bacillus cereus]